VVSAQDSLFDEAEPWRARPWSVLSSPLLNSTPIQAVFDSETSVDAGIANMPNRAGQRERVLAYLSEHPSTDEQVQDALGLDPNTQRPRRVELAQAGLIKKVGVRKTRAGRQAAVWGVA
jgi:hypothetical protein